MDIVRCARSRAAASTIATGGARKPRPPMQVRLFGWFLAEIDRQPIEWIRRRDRQIFKYVALQPGRHGLARRARAGLLAGRRAAPGRAEPADRLLQHP